jgi:hypothetical protein
MWKRFLVAMASLVFLTTNSYAVLAQPVTAPASQKKDPNVLVIRLKNASLEDLKKLSFLDLNILKNAVYASKGYEFANDRPWLNEIFCDKHKAKKKKKLSKVQQKHGAPTDKEMGIVSDVDEPSLTAKESLWNLDNYAFPECREGGPLDEDQKKAIANTRVALFKKIETLGSILEVDKALNLELHDYASKQGTTRILGKKVSEDALLTFGDVSMRRDLHGINRMLQIIKEGENFDAMELLGLFMGDIVFLRNTIEAKYGKPFVGVQGWEISQIIGIPERRSDYDPEKLPIQVQQKLQLLDEIAVKIQRSGLNDIPAAFRNRPIEFNNPYDYEGC